MKLIYSLVFATGFAAFVSEIKADPTMLTEGTNMVSQTQPGAPTDPSLKNALYLDANAPIEKRVEDLLARLTLQEKVSLLFGCNGMGLGDIPRVGLPAVNFTDGPQGVRLGKSKTTGFPAAVGMTASWDQSLIEKVGEVLGQECLASDRLVLLAPGLNMMRSPLGGRHFEYAGEDPYLAGFMVSGYIKGVQSQGVAACPKHWILNDQEVCRGTIDVQCDPRAFREIYAKPFQIAFETSHPWAVMPAYNRKDGVYCGENKDLLRGLLYGEFGFDGVTISDWGAIKDLPGGINAGCTIQMPYQRNEAREKKIMEKIQLGVVSMEAVDFNVRQNLRLLFRVGAFQAHAPGAVNTSAHQKIARKVATESIVLLKNQGNLLPLDAGRLGIIAVIGPNADAQHTMAYGSPHWAQGKSGASNPPYEITPLKALQQRYPDKIIYAPGFTFEKKNAGDNQFAAAVAAAKQADVVLLFAGLDLTLEGEAMKNRDDRKDLEMIGPQAELIAAVTKANPKTIVILNNGAPVNLEPWNDTVPALVEAWYGGMEAGNAVCDVLFGVANPSGKLPCTFGAKLTDWRTHQFDQECWPGTGENGKIVYKESIWVGYRWFDHSKIKPLYPFGFGLSYTDFAYSDFKIREENGIITATVAVTNKGKRAGAEVVQLYMAPPANQPIERPEQELRRFERLELAPGATKTAVFTLSKKDFAYYDVNLKAWNTLPGLYELRAAASSRDVRATATVNISK